MACTVFQHRITTDLYTGLMVLVFIVLLFLPRTIAASEKRIPFSPGEKMVFHVRWEFVPAGEATLEVLPFATMHGEQAYHFSFSVKTYEYVDLIYKVRDRIDSYTDLGVIRSLQYQIQKRGRSKKDVVVTFDWEKGQAVYESAGHTREPISLKPATLDPLSVFFGLRLYDLSKHPVIKTAVTDGKKCVEGVARVINRETITTHTGTHETYLVEPDLEEIGGVFQKSKNAKLQIWVTADELSIPVRIKSRVKVGSFVAELISYQRGAAE